MVISNLKKKKGPKTVKNRALIVRASLFILLLVVFILLKIFSYENRNQNDQTKISDKGNISLIQISSDETGQWYISNHNNSWIIDIGQTTLPAIDYSVEAFIDDFLTKDRETVATSGSFNNYLGDSPLNISFMDNNGRSIYSFNIGYENEENVYMEFDGKIYQLVSEYSRTDFDQNSFIEKRLFPNLNNYADIISFEFDTDFTGEFSEYYKFQIYLEDIWKINSESINQISNVSVDYLENYLFRLINLKANSFMPTTEELGQVRARLSLSSSNGEHYQVEIGETIPSQPVQYKARVEGNEWVYLLSEEDLKEIFISAENFIEQ